MNKILMHIKSTLKKKKFYRFYWLLSFEPILILYIRGYYTLSFLK